jgi:glycosyltransferase involved in cell wall biosynthesis
MRILICTDEFPPKVWGGMSRSVESIALGLAELSIEVDIISHFSDNSDRNIRTDQFLNGKIYWLRYPLCKPKEINNYISVSKYDLIYVNGRGFANFAQMAATKFGTTVFYSSRSNYYEEVKFDEKGINETKAELQNTLFRISKGIIVASRNEKTRLKRYYPEIEKTTKVIPNPVHPSFEQEQEVLSRSQGKIIYVGRFVRHKGISVLIDALPRIFMCNKDAHIVFVGGHGNSEIAGLISVAKENFHQKINVRDWLSIEELKGEYQTAQIIVIPSFYESFGNVAIEAMASKCCVIASEVGGLKEVIINNVNGLLFRPGDPADLANSVVKLLEDQDLAKKLRSNGLKTIRIKHNYKKVAKLYLDFFLDTLQTYDKEEK